MKGLSDAKRSPALACFWSGGDGRLSAPDAAPKYSMLRQVLFGISWAFDGHSTKFPDVGDLGS
jgi:hypothetical protein